MLINNLPLPDSLIELLSSGKWERPIDVNKLKELTKFESPQYLIFLGLASIEGETNSAIELVTEGYGRYYSINSSRATGRSIVNSNTLDVDKALIIAVNQDEEVICLDYRESLEAPIVVVSVYQHGTECEFKVIAETFDEFAIKIGLKE